LGGNLVRNFHKLDALSCVSDTYKDTAGGIAATYGVAARSFDEILVDKAVQGIVIATSVEQHAKMAEAALLAGKNAFVEKHFPSMFRMPRNFANYPVMRGWC